MKQKSILFSFFLIATTSSVLLMSQSASALDDDSSADEIEMQRPPLEPKAPLTVSDRIRALKECDKTSVTSLLTSKFDDKEMNSWVQTVKQFYPEKATTTPEEHKAWVKSRRASLELENKFMESENLSDELPDTRSEQIKRVDVCLKKIYSQSWSEQEGTKEKIRKIYTTLHREFPAEMGSGAISKSPSSAVGSSR